MIKTRLTLSGLLLALVLTGCQLEQASPLTLENASDIGGTQSTNKGYYSITNKRMDHNDTPHYGYSRFQREQVHKPNGDFSYPIVDRTEISTNITKMVLTNPEIDEAATLVTDQYALVVYETHHNEDDNNSRSNKEEIAAYVRKTAESALPRFYEVVVADDHNQIESIERFQSLSSRSTSIYGTLEETIEQLREYPQGTNYNTQSDYQKN
ncbi:hypothetical protein AJ85_03230 [Alkalihalobacillus alcalophilus ATCC 27647 = CGMCC 1.3604]|uniref:Sporulation protein n=1 Tax=Alkalihalobacillus alcalophilus ATCC 27647 = CGMCC 1.3604 TaxID=1218173 RepID=A0A4S4K6A4_ALKAL|nr:YhcN/YlaJ family sporulation lipoprotein [Alkalihalobacillus alcalophilus]MED1564023.1 YhcN/YlaJ family sporulation lipoprotein [Alkalihalobacillus alcalophilus]THG91669.1 hypothetical protein AJ85_03230 [Alkalihalobacillus alcalophilus ATCC 27647 = CGMCC 1.3604]